MTESSPLPEFSQSTYTATVLENLPPPQLLVDLNTYDELAGINVTYYIISGAHSGLFFMENGTGKLWATRTLDRETVALYEVKVGCQQANTIQGQMRKKRSVQGK